MAFRGLITIGVANFYSFNIFLWCFQILSESPENAKIYRQNGQNQGTCTLHRLKMTLGWCAVGIYISSEWEEIYILRKFEDIYILISYNFLISSVNIRSTIRTNSGKTKTTHYRYYARFCFRFICKLWIKSSADNTWKNSQRWIYEPMIRCKPPKCPFRSEFIVRPCLAIILVIEVVLQTWINNASTNEKIIKCVDKIVISNKWRNIRSFVIQREYNVRCGTYVRTRTIVNEPFISNGDVSIWEKSYRERDEMITVSSVTKSLTSQL